MIRSAAMETWLHRSAPAWIALLAQVAIVAPADAAWVNRNLLHGLLSRAPAAADAEPALDAKRLEDCIRAARDLDRMAVSLDNQMIVIQDTTSWIAYSHTLDGPQLPRPDRTEKELSAEFEHRLAERAVMQKRLERDTDAYRRQLATYNSGVERFERDCNGTFRSQDLDAVKARLGLE
jgi:hypothetical protein